MSATERAYRSADSDPRLSPKNIHRLPIATCVKCGDETHDFVRHSRGPQCREFRACSKRVEA